MATEEAMEIEKQRCSDNSGWICSKTGHKRKEKTKVIADNRKKCVKTEWLY